MVLGEHTLVHDHPQRRRIVAVQDRLPCQPDGHQLVYLVLAGVRPGGEDGPRLVLCLEQAGYW
jgi:hypothetical protein